jgi:uncharacterized protein YdhG (YjbR/CyaY superfamily)
MATKSKSDPAAVEAYLANLPMNEREALERLRTLIKATIPGVDERISYETAVMFSLGRDLVGLVAQKKHLSFLTASPRLMDAMKSEVTKTHKVSGATVHFSPENPLPSSVVKKILKARVSENAAEDDRGAGKRSAKRRRGGLK